MLPVVAPKEPSDITFTIACATCLTYEAPHFPVDSAVLGPAGKRILDQIVNCMLRGTLMDESLIVVDYAEPRVGGNLKFALQRARAAAQYLVEMERQPIT